MGLQTVVDKFRWYQRHAPRIGVELGVPPSWFGYRWIQHETVAEYFARNEAREAAGRCETVHPASVARHPLPANVASREALPDDPGWWGFSFRDVPARPSEATQILTLPDCRIVWYRDPEQDDDFFPAILTHDDHALDLREVRFRPRHAETLRRAKPPVRLERATWILERVYHNHSHWLTAHLPKLLLLRERGELDDLLLPPTLTRTMEGSLRMLGLDPDGFRRFDPAQPLAIGELTVLQTDRFRPELLQMVQQAFAAPDGASPHRRVYVSRDKASRRQLVNEDEVWPLLAEVGFERVFMEDLSFRQQVELMRETAVFAGPHGAGLTNMMFCAPGTHIIEMADLSFPNPNFYALASGLGHRYWILEGETAGDGHPLERDFRIDEEALRAVLRRLPT